MHGQVYQDFGGDARLHPTPRGTARVRAAPPATVGCVERAHPEDIPHRREDGETVGWMRPSGEGFVAIDLLGRAVTEEVDWLTAEEALESAGIGYLADPWTLQLDDGTALRVRIVEVSRDGIRVKKDDWGAIDSPQLDYRLPWPIPDALTHGDHSAPGAAAHP